MKTHFLKIISLSLVASTSFAAVTAATSKEEFCENRKDPTYARELVQDYRNQLSFTNQGGLQNGGVCWWHSMFTRKATYLTYYRPDLKKPSDKEAKKIITAIKNGYDVVMIPGYRNLREFSYDHDQLILNQLESWQISDGIFGFGFLRGMTGKPELASSQLRKSMDEMYKDVRKNNEIIYQKLQFPGITAHAWLVADMEKTNNGYHITVIDSNTGTDHYRYQYGDTNLSYHGYQTFAPHTSRNGNNDRFLEIQSDFCSGKKRERPNRDRRSATRRR
jgi:hypothetical protein